MVLKEIQQMVHPEMTHVGASDSIDIQDNAEERMKQIAINHWTTPR